MTRPSHWILISFAAFASVVTATGNWRRAFTAPRVDHWASQRGMQARRAVEFGHPVELFGAVFDRAGRPVEGALVTSRGDAEKRARTDAAGRFSLVVSGRGSHDLSIEADGLAAVHSQVAVPGQPMFAVLRDETPWRDADADVAEPSLLVGEGYLRDERGEPVAFGRVAVRETGATVIADHTGRFRVPLPVGTDATLVATDGEGRVARSQPFRSNRQSGLVPVERLQIEEGAVLGGYVRDETGRVVDGAIVIASDGEVRHIAITGRGGTYFIDGLCPDSEYALTVLPHDGKLGSAQSLVVRGEMERDLFLTTAEDRRLRVVRPVTGEGVAGAHVVFAYGSSFAFGIADADGWIELDDAAPKGLATDSVGITIHVRDADLEPLVVRSVKGDTITVGD